MPRGTGLLPRNENDTFEMPPEMHPGRFSLDPGASLDEVGPVGRVLLDAGRQRKTVRVEDDVPAGNRPLRSGSDRPARRSPCGAPGCRPARLVERHHHDGGAVACGTAGLADELLLALLHGDRVDDRLALDVLQAGLDDLPFRESTITGTRLMSGSAAIRLVNRSIAATPSIMPSSMLMSMTCAPTSTCCAQPTARCRSPGLDQVAEPGRSGDVRALTDVDEQRAGGDVEGSRRFGVGWRPRSGHRAGLLAFDDLRDLGDVRRRVPQQPPTRLTRPASANSAITGLTLRDSSYSKALGRPAFG